MKRLSQFKWLLAAVLSVLISQAARSQGAVRTLAPHDWESVPRAIHFSGFDWLVKSSHGSVGPGPNVFAMEGVRVDPQGRLHLAISPQDGHWICSEVISKRSFGYGTYRFVVRETANLDINAVLGLFTWDTSAPEHQYREVDIEMSRWGYAENMNAQFVIQPFARAENLDRFELPPGRAVLSFTWSPGRLLCRASVHGRVVREHLFTQGVPVPGKENVRMNLWLYRSMPPANGKPVEVVVDRFEFLPESKGN